MKCVTIYVVALSWAVIVSSNKRITHDIHQTTGVIRENLGHVTFVKDVVTVKLSLKELNSFTEVLKGTKEQIDTLLRHPAKDKVWNTTLDLLKTQNEKLSHIVPSRRKRSLFSWGGDVLHAVFGTATDGQVQEVKEKMKLIEKWANIKGKVIQSSIKQLNAQSSRIVELDQNLFPFSD